MALFAILYGLVLKSELYVYISEGFNRLRKIPLLFNVLAGIYVSLAIGEVFVVFSLQNWYIKKEEIYCLLLAGAIVWMLPDTVEDFTKANLPKKVVYFGLILLCMSLSISIAVPCAVCFFSG